MDQRGKPKVYWLAYKPPGPPPADPDEGTFIYSHQTPFTTNTDDENKSGSENQHRQTAEEPDLGARVRGLLENPEADWVPAQLVKYRRAPERLSEPTCAAIAATLGVPARAAEVRPHLEAYVAKEDEETEGVL
jgi:hypothetical protein